ncbi:MAG: ferredoxin reductase family protein [Actinomycetota bacterium]|nr:ferredoxin reductase family protein [Actinomycetota bacterium]
MKRRAAPTGGDLGYRLRRARGPLTVALVCTVPLILWVSGSDLGERVTDISSLLSTIAVGFALVGTAAFASNLFVGARPPFVERYFNGLDKLFIAHQRIGRWAFLLLLAHVTLVVVSRAAISLDAAWDLFSGGAGGVVTVGLIAFALMTASILATLFARLNHEVFVYVQRSFGFIFMIAAVHVFRTPGAKDGSELLTWYLLLLAALGVGAFAYRSVFGDSLVRRYAYEVVRVRLLGESVTEITMVPKADRIMFTPGQFVFVSFPHSAFDPSARAITLEGQGAYEMVTFDPSAIENQFHPFSIASGPADPELRIVVKAIGDYTRALRNLQVGAPVKVEGPYGALSHMRIRNPRQIWVAGGIGVTPFLSMARSLDASKYEVDFYYCTESSEDDYFSEELGAIADRDMRFRVIPVHKDSLGFVTAQDIANGSRDIAQKDILICGPPPMMLSLQSQFVAIGVPERQIHFENFRFK